MRTAASTVCPPSPLTESLSPRDALLSRALDYAALTKPRISLMALAAVSAGYSLCSDGIWDGVRLVNALVGIGLVAAASSALNQLLESESDARMPRTANRPLPAGRLGAREVLAFGVACGLSGVICLAVRVNALTAFLAALTLLLYVAVYTPLKKHSSLCTAVGAVPGALPPVLGWTAAGGSLDGSAFALFSILYLWQFPHFLAIAWLYRDDYARGGLKMLPLAGRAPRVVGVLSVGYCLALLPVSLLPGACGLAGRGYTAATLVLGLGYLTSALRFGFSETRVTARRLLAASLIYLPVLLGVLVWDHWRLLW